MPDPAEIQEQIEGTRAELASTIDAIADRLHPKRVASRGVETVKTKVEDLRSRGTVAPANAAALGDTSGGQRPLPDRLKAQLREAKETNGRSVRWDRVAIVGAVIGVIALVKRRRSRSS